MALRRPGDHRRPPDHLARDPRQRLRVRLRGRRPAPPGLGLAGRASSATCCCSRVFIAATFEPTRSSRCSARPGGRSSSSSPASTAGGAGTRCKAHGAPPTRRRSRPRWATARRAARPTSSRGPPASWSASGCSPWSAPAGPRRAGTTGATPGSSSARWSRPTRWPAAGTTSGWPGSPSTWSACRCCGTASYYPTAILYVVYGGLVVWGFVVWLRASRREAARARGGSGMSPSNIRLDTVERAIADIAAGKAVVVVDDEDRENEGDLIFAAAKATPELMAFTIRHTSGVICVPMPADDARPARDPADDAAQPRPDAHGVHGLRRRPRRRHHRHLRRRPRPHRAGPGRLGHRAVGGHPARPRLPAALPRGRGAGAPRAHRGRGRPGPARRPRPRPACSSRSSTTTAP